MHRTYGFHEGEPRETGQSECDRVALGFVEFVIMPAIVSDRVMELMDSGSSEQKVVLHVLTSKEMSNQVRDDIMERLTKIAGPDRVREIMKGSGILSVRTTVRSVREISTIAGLEWIDLDSAASIEELCDDKG